MCQPTTLVLALVLLLGTAARAQPSPAREKRQRSVTVTGNPADPPHEIHAAKGVATVLLFKSQIDGGTVEVDKTRVKIIDAGEWSIIFEPVIELGRDERLVLSVPFADGQRAVFLLVSHATEVDTRIDVTRHEQTVESCRAELAAAQARCAKISPMTIVRSGLVDGYGVQVRAIITAGGHVSAGGLSFNRGKSYCAGNWVLVAVGIRNDGAPWILREAVLRSAKTGERVVVRSIEMEHEQVASGETGFVFVETEAPLKSAGSDFVLELSDTASGRSLSVPNVKLGIGK